MNQSSNSFGWVLSEFIPRAIRESVADTQPHEFPLFIEMAAQPDPVIADLTARR